MKKLVFMFVAIAAISFASCGQKNAAPAAETDSTAVVDSAAADTAAVDTAAADTAVAE
jgi:predicted small lipoprotein YifL